MREREGNRVWYMAVDFLMQLRRKLFMELMNWVETADYFKIPADKSKEQRTRKIKNWLKNKVLPRWVTVKIGNDVFFIKEELDRFVLGKRVGKA